MSGEWDAALRAYALVNRESSVVSEAGLNPLKAIPNNLHKTGILCQHAQTRPEPVLGLERGLRGQGPAADGHAGPSRPGRREKLIESLIAGSKSHPSVFVPRLYIPRRVCSAQRT